MVFEKVRNIIAEKLDVDSSLVTMQSKFVDMQVDSLYMVEIMLAIEETFGIVLAETSNVQCVADLVACVEKKLA